MQRKIVHENGGVSKNSGGFENENLEKSNFRVRVAGGNLEGWCYYSFR
jgi:hypothetical protein